MTDVTPIYASPQVGGFMLLLIAVILYLTISEWGRYLMHRQIDRDGFSDPRLNELSQNLRFYGLRPTTLSLIKAVLLTLMLGAAIYVGEPSVSPLIHNWLG